MKLAISGIGTVVSRGTLHQDLAAARRLNGVALSHCPLPHKWHTALNPGRMAFVFSLNSRPDKEFLGYNMLCEGIIPANICAALGAAQY